MVAATLAGGLFCFTVFCLTLKEMDRGKISIRQPGSYRLSGSVLSEGVLSGRSSDSLSGTIQGNISGASYGGISGDLSGSIDGHVSGNSDRFTGYVSGNTRGNLSGSINNNLNGQLFGQMHSNTLTQFAGSTQSKGFISGDISPESLYGNEILLERPGRPWLCVGLIALGFAMLTYVRRLYLVVRRKKAALGSTRLVAQVTAAGGLAFFAGADSQAHDYLPLGPCLIAYAGLGYLAYTHWERVRAQLHKA